MNQPALRPTFLLEVIAACTSIGVLAAVLAIFGTGMGIGLLVAIVIYVLVGLELGLVPALLGQLAVRWIGPPRGRFARLWVAEVEPPPVGAHTPGREAAPDNPTLW